MYKLKYYNVFACLAFACCSIVKEIKAQEDNLEPASGASVVGASQIFVPADNLTNFATRNNVFILVPASANISDLQADDAANFNLFKLNTDVLFSSDNNNNNKDQHGATRDGTDIDHHIEELQNSEARRRVVRDLDGGGFARGSRKINLLNGLWNKPRTSPLYLINGTVCRFVNTQPICTTLSTTGLLRGSGGGGGTAAGGGGGVGGGATTARPNASGVQFANQPPRPAGLMDDDAQDINVESSVANSSESSMVVRAPQQQQQQLQQLQQTRPMMTSPVMQAVRPMNFVVNRRPLNFLGLRRPGGRQQYPMPTVGGRASDIADRVQLHGQAAGRGGRTTA